MCYEKDIQFLHKMIWYRGSISEEATVRETHPNGAVDRMLASCHDIRQPALFKSGIGAYAYNPKLGILETQEDPKVKIILTYLVSSKIVWDTWNLVSKINKQKTTENYTHFRKRKISDFFVFIRVGKSFKFYQWKWL